jgi:hypothetical protein
VTEARLLAYGQLIVLAIIAVILFALMVRPSSLAIDCTSSGKIAAIGRVSPPFQSPLPTIEWGTNGTAKCYAE